MPARVSRTCGREPMCWQPHMLDYLLFLILGLQERRLATQSLKQRGMETWHLTQGWPLRLACSTRRDRMWSFCLRPAAAVQKPAMLGAWAPFLELGRLHRARWFHLTDSIYLTWNGHPGGHLVVTYSIRNIRFQNRLSAGNTGQLGLFLVLLWQEPQRELELTFLCL